MMKNVLKAIFVSKIFKFLQKDRLYQIDKVNFKIYDVTNWKTNNCNIRLLYILRSKGNQTTTFGQLIEYNRNVFLEKLFAKTIPRPFSKKSNLSISLDQYSNVLHSLFLLYAKFRTIRLYLTQTIELQLYFIRLYQNYLITYSAVKKVSFIHKHFDKT